MIYQRLIIIGLLAAALASGRPVAVVENQGFCAGGAAVPLSLPSWGSYCGKGDADLGRIATSSFQLAGDFSILLSGNPAGPNLNLWLENVSGGQRLRIRPNVFPGIRWLKSDFALPPSWRGQDLRLVAEDQSLGSMGWLAFSAPFPTDPHQAIHDARLLLLKTPLFTLLIFLPGFALCALAIKHGIYGIPKLGLILLAGVAIPGYLVFFVSVLSPRAGYALSLALPYLAGAALLTLLFRLTPGDRQRLRVFLVPLGFIFFASMALLSLGYLFGGLDTANGTAAIRFSHPLPSDNSMPYIFAEDLKRGTVPKPMQGNWLSSDRPPLETGMILALQPWAQSREIWYSVASVIIQNLWIFALWLLMRAFRIGRLTVALVVATICGSGFAIVNTFYVWPKLLAAAYLVAFAIPILTMPVKSPRAHWFRVNWWMRLLLAFLLACSALSHGGTAFALLGLLAGLLFRFQIQVLQEICIVGAIATLFYLPWVGYQKFVDPPGDRLLKYHLAGVEQVTNKPALATIIQAYREQTLGALIKARRANATVVFGHELEYLRDALQFTNPQHQVEIRLWQFFYFLPGLGFVLVGVVGLCWRSRNKVVARERKAAERLWLWAFVTTIPWILLEFEPGSTVVHAGAYAMELSAMAGSILAFRAVAPRLAIIVCLVQCAFNWVVYEPNLVQSAFPDSLAAVRNDWMLALHVASMIGFLLVMAWSVVRGNISHAPLPASFVAAWRYPFRRYHAA